MMRKETTKRDTVQTKPNCERCKGNMTVACVRCSFDEVRKGDMKSFVITFSKGDRA